ncbi:hypothetical protein A1O1_04469 [Capronia coronata CBS 617.96]|uniref:laccase n=1 Tax=Capronia coronata CBS 617.96 TaxID=1182541 RepID=W9YET3_9EURO|nr:uncharacterized protein A1O1_04469 [Capronia coronata CBS 617.96]EXJ91357.1 hypothetical protein A1O1_04469 [Capronia coronata CBS 617.96]
MRFTRVPGLLAVALAATVLAENEDTACSTSTVTTTTTTTATIFKEATTVYWSTVYAEPTICATTTVTVNGNGASTAPSEPSTSALADSTLAPVSTTATVVVAANAESEASSGGSTTITSFLVDPTSAGNPNSEESTIGTDAEVFTWTGDAPTDTSSLPAPTYTSVPDDGTLPAPGSASSNVTAPQAAISDGSCNTAADRSKWCDGRSVSTDYYAAAYSTGQTCSYELTITNTTIDYDGSGPKMAFAINGQVPGPLIECNWGDILEVTVHNNLENNATSIHWHGITQKESNDQDGVPGVTECGIAPGTSRTYTMKLNQYGTGWYHSHTMTQYGDGIRGPMVVHGPATASYDIDMGTVMIDDIFDATAAQMNERIAHSGPSSTVNYLLNGKNTLQDLSAGQHALWSVQPGKKHLFRIINSGVQNMYSVHIDDHVMTVIAADYVPIVPYTTEWLNIGIGQRYDVIVEMNQPVAGYFLRAVTQTGCPSGCGNSGLGNANGIILYEGAEATLPTSTYGNKTASDFAICADEPIASLVPFLEKTAGSADQFAATAATVPAGKVAQIATSDDGSVVRWYINNGAINVNYTQPTLKTLADGSNSSLISNPITLNVANQWVYFIIQNQFFASHPIHLHGHDMSVLGQGSATWTTSLLSTLNFNNPTRRDTAMLVGSSGPGNPAGYTVIGFETDNPGAWLMHCHIVWHVDGGLALQFTERPADILPYANSTAFQDECSSLATWQGNNPARIHTSGESGLKRRTSLEELLDTRSRDDVVRRSESHEKLHLESKLKRGLGDSLRHRHIRH